MKVVVVESPAKAKTINRYLGDGYKVLASYGHVRDLPPKDGSVKPDNDFEMAWQTDANSTKQMKEITSALSGADKLILATDPDREGEAISWHVREMVQEKKQLRDIPYERVVFNEITKTAILEAMEHPRDLDTDLIDAYLARRALDYLVGFSISPVLWRKLPGSRSAGRVQSVALRLVCEREAEIEKFVPVEYWSLDTLFKKQDGQEFTARLTHFDGKKLDKLSVSTEAEAKAIEAQIKASNWQVGTVETKRVKRNPYAPFTTSTLQQEASRKLGFSASRTMQIAQKLYEGVNIGSETTGLITYMRTDGVQISNEAVQSARSVISEQFGARYVPEKPRIYKTKAANAQEAHEAVRPTALHRTPEKVSAFLDYDQRRLYDLIWKRTIASQMASAELDQTSAQLNGSESQLSMRASGSVVVFDGFRSVYADNTKTEDGSDNILPPLPEGESAFVVKPLTEQHFTQPPARYSDASLVKKMEELGIGRPSTYASILGLLEKRNYVRKDQRRFIPEHRGRIVSTFLENFFSRYVEYDFTAGLEQQLDQVSDGKLPWRQVLHSFWHDFKLAVESTTDLSVPDVLKTLDEQLEQLFFTPSEDGKIDRLCAKCQKGRLELKLGRFGPFLGCDNYPDCGYTRQVGDNDNDADGLDEDKLLGNDPVSELPVYLRKGPYGFYVQAGALEEKKPKRSSLPKDKAPLDVDLEYALGLLSLPRDIGNHPETGDMIQAGLGRYGPYLKYQGKFTSLPAGDDVLSVGINRSVDLLAEAAKKAGRPLGDHPDGGTVELKRGRFGGYVEHNKLRAPIKRGTEMADVTLEMALELLAAKAAKGPTAKKAAKKSAKKSAKKAAKSSTKAKAKKAAKKASGKSTAKAKAK